MQSTFNVCSNVCTHVVLSSLQIHSFSTEVCWITACPAGTYKNESSPGDEMSCTPCPDPNHTSEEGSTSVDQCHCKAGYRLDPLDNRTCTGVARLRRSAQLLFNTSN